MRQLKPFFVVFVVLFAAPNFTHPFWLEVDVSALGAEAVLLLEDKHRNDHPIC